MISISGAAVAVFRGGSPAPNHLRSVIRFKNVNKEAFV
jgi:hypothetical protein